MLAKLGKAAFAAVIVFAAMRMTAASAATPAGMDADLLKLARQWAHVTYQVKSEDAQDKQMRALDDEAGNIVKRYPNRAEPLIWQGVIASSEAKYAGTFSALGFAKQARSLLEKAGRFDYRALGGAVPTSLGALYYKVPGFPIGFGDNDKARQYLEQAVQMSPNGLDANFFYGDFLYQQGDYKKASAVLRRALRAPVNPERPVWDAGRRGEIRSLLAKVNEELASNQ